MSLLRSVDADQRSTAGHRGQLAIPLLDLLVLDQGVRQSLGVQLVCYTRKKLKEKRRVQDMVVTEEKRKKGEELLQLIERRSMGN